MSEGMLSDNAADVYVSNCVYIIVPIKCMAITALYPV